MTGLATWRQPIHVIGLGGIGCQVIWALSAMGAPRLTLWDDDIVENHNRPSQALYRPQDDGRLKVEATRDYLVRQGFRGDIALKPERVTPASKRELRGIVISGVDTMVSRRDIWAAVKHNVYVFHYFDARIGDEEMQLHTVNPLNPDNIDRYESWLRIDDTPQNDMGCVTREKPYSAMDVAAELSVRLPLVIDRKEVEGFVHRNLLLQASVRQPVGA